MKNIYLKLIYRCFLIFCVCIVSVVSPRSEIIIEPTELLIEDVKELAAGSYLSYNVNLKANDELVVNFQVAGGLDNSIKVWLVDSANLSRFSNRQQYSYFKGTSGAISGQANYVFKVPASGTYHVVVDNTNALLLSRKIYTKAYRRSDSPSEFNKQEKEAMGQVYAGMKKLFIFQDFDVTVELCDMNNAFSEIKTGNITICRELIYSNQSKGFSNATSFVMLHEYGHSLMNLWGLPLADNEDVADEFATVMTILMSRREMAIDAANQYASNPIRSEGEAQYKLNNYDRHSLSVQRARNIQVWLQKESELLQRWFKLLVPHFTDEALLTFKKDPKYWVNSALLDKEIKSRKLTALGSSSAQDTQIRSSYPSPYNVEGPKNSEKVLGTWQLEAEMFRYIVVTYLDGGYFTFEQYTQKQKNGLKTGEGAGKWALNGKFFTGEVTSSNTQQVPIGLKWRDELISVNDEELKLFTENGTIENWIKL